MTRKGSDQTAHMRRLVSAFAGRTYHHIYILSVVALDEINISGCLCFSRVSCSGCFNTSVINELFHFIRTTDGVVGR